jgi:hypothetical protein
VKVPRTRLLLGLGLIPSLVALGCGPPSAPAQRPLTSAPTAAVASSPASSPVEKPADGGQPPFPREPEARLTLRPPLSSEPVVVVSITTKALVITLRARGGEEPQVVETIARRPGTPPYDYAAFNRALARLVRTRWPDPAKRPADSQQMMLGASPETTYETVVQVMDAARAVRPGSGVADAGRILFPDVILRVSP